MPDAPESVPYTLTGSADTQLSIWLFRDVKNSKSVRFPVPEHFVQLHNRVGALMLLCLDLRQADQGADRCRLHPAGAGIHQCKSGDATCLSLLCASSTRVGLGMLTPHFAQQVQDLSVVRAAAQKAFAASLCGALRTRSLHAELVFNIAGSKHVGGLRAVHACAPGWGLPSDGPGPWLRRWESP
jgi:hypothetical protein